MTCIIWSPERSCLRKSRTTSVNRVKQVENCSTHFVDERLETGKVNFWLTMRKTKLKTWPSSCKVIKMKAAVKVVELKEDRSLFAQLMMICKSRPEVDIKKAIALEFPVDPRSLSAPDGTIYAALPMLECPYAYTGEARG